MRGVLLFAALGILAASLSSYVIEKKEVVVEAKPVVEEKIELVHPHFHRHHHDTVIIQTPAPRIEEKIEIK
jgi:hypothetical protein